MIALFAALIVGMCVQELRRRGQTDEARRRSARESRGSIPVPRIDRGEREQ